MATQRDPNSNDLADWLRRCIVISGYCLAAWQFVVTFFVAITLGEAWRFYFRTDWPLLGRGLLGALYVMSTVLLAIGCWGLQHYRHWARPILVAFAGTWIFGQFARAVVSCIGFYLESTQWRSFKPSDVFIVMTNYYLDPAVYASVYAVGLVACLRRPELRDKFPKMRRGFAPVFRDDAGTA
jgi:hypothetical protein